MSAGTEYERSLVLSRTRRLKAGCDQVWRAEDPLGLRESATNLSPRALLFQALPDGRDLRFRDMESFQGFVND